MTISISTQQFTQSTLPLITSLQKQLNDAETEATTGRYADVGETLGYQTGQDVSLRAQSDILSAIKDSNTVIANNLTATQSALTSIASDAQSFLDTLVSAQSGGGDLSTLQSQAQSVLSDLTSALNSNVGGTYLFGGTNTAVQPVQDYDQTPASAAQNAVAAAFSAAFPGVTQNSSQESSIDPSSLSTFLSGSFASLFSSSSWKSTWSSATDALPQNRISTNEVVSSGATANNPAFAQLASAYVSIADLGVNNLSQSAAATLVTSATATINSALSSLTNLQSNIGVTQSQITNANSNIDLQTTLLNNNVSSLESVDTAQASTQLTELQTQLETAYSLTGKLSQLSLISYLPTTL